MANHWSLLLMNDERAGQLTENWTIPDYAQPHLWLTGEAGSAQCEGAAGLFELDFPETVVTLRWGSDEGAPLRQFRWQPDTLGWRGEFRLGGMVEALHMMALPGTDLSLVVVFFSGQPLLPDVTPYPDAAQRAVTRFRAPNWYESIDDEPPPTIITLLALEDSSLVTIAQDAMLNKMPLHAYGRLADEEQGFHRFVALPLLWEAATLFAP